MAKATAALPAPTEVPLKADAAFTQVGKPVPRQSAAEGTPPIAARIWTLGRGTLDFSVNFLVMLYFLFFLLRDGRALLAGIGRSMPLDTHAQRQLLRSFGASIWSTVKGNVIVALIHGALGGMALMVVGIPAALLWAVVMAFLSLLPVIGAALVWGSVALYLLMTGHVGQGVTLFAFSRAVIGPARRPSGSRRRRVAATFAALDTGSFDHFAKSAGMEEPGSTRHASSL